MKKIMFIILAILVLLITVYLVFLTIAANNELVPNEKGHIITGFRLSESSSNDMAAWGESKSYHFSLYENTLNVEIVDLSDVVMYEMSETERKNLEQELSVIVEIELDKADRDNLEQELLALIETHSLKKWNGYDEIIETLDDFHSFTFSVEYANEKEIYAHGDHIFPKDYRGVFNDVQAVFLKHTNKVK